MNRASEHKAIAAATVGHFFWGLSFLASRTALNTAPVILLLSHRFLLAFALMSMLRKRLDLPVLCNEDLGYDSDAKEAVAFAMLAAECIHGVCNNVPAVTGAAHPVVMGKISI